MHCLCKNLQTCLPTSRRPGKSYTNSSVRKSTKFFAWENFFFYSILLKIDLKLNGKTKYTNPGNFRIKAINFCIVRKLLELMRVS